jgi:hypothetical protein
MRARRSGEQKWSKKVDHVRTAMSSNVFWM